MSKNSTHDRTTFGVWVYLMSDCVLFACLFAAYAVLHTATGAGPSSIEIFDRSFVLIETLVLLASSFTCGLALLAARRGSTAGTWVALLSTLALGATFLGMEFHEFSALVASGASWQASAFLSSYFTLVGTHGLHIVIGLLWLLILCLHIAIVGVQKQTVNNLLYFSLFWHFLDIVWICIFSFVYLFGSLPV